MALTKRQEILYTHTIDLYRPMPMVGGVLPSGQTHDMVHELAYEGVPCYVMFTTEFDQPVQGAGRSKTMNFETQDILHLQLSQECGDGWKFQFTAAGHPESGGWWTVLGNAKTLARANTREFQSSRDLSAPTIDRGEI